MGELMHWADDAMYEAQPMLKEGGAGIRPRVFLLSATPDPLGNLAADMRMYRGDPVYSLDEITDEQRRWAWEELSKTRLNTPLEGVQIKFMIEAVTRSFTHQMVRQRVGAYYVQESLRFAVKRGLVSETALPPSIIPGPAADEPAFKIWSDTIKAIHDAYNGLVDAGIPAEDARGLLPHAVTTRIIYTTNLRALFEMVGNRLCTQAQFEWRAVVLEMMKALKGHMDVPTGYYYDDEVTDLAYDNAWQWELIATPTPMTFAPICYKLGHCAFMAELDRGCSIRPRVEAFAKAGVPSEMWGDKAINWAAPMGAIHPEEWMANANAGRTTEDNPRPS
jgi:flavin-dependent thymidylate synthase